MKRLCEFIYFLISLGTAMVGYTIHHSIFWSIVDFLIMPLVWAKWLVCKEVNITILKETFGFFLQ